MNRSAKAYLRSGAARKLPIVKCYILENWEEAMSTQIIVVREHKSKSKTFAYLLVDLLCVGVKNCAYFFNCNQSDYDDFINKINSNLTEGLVECDYELAHNIIYNSVDYAYENGIAPVKEFELASMILEEDTDDFPFIDTPTGHKGKPHLFITHPSPRDQYYIAQLNKTVGKGNYYYTAGYGSDIEGCL